MRTLFRAICIIFFSSACFAMEQNLVEEFKNDFARRIATVEKINKKIQSLNEESAPAHFGESVGAYRIRNIKNLFFHCENSLKYYGNDINGALPMAEIESQLDLSNHLFIQYCQNIYFTKALHAEMNVCKKDSPARKDVGKVIDSLSIYGDYLTEEYKYFASFLKIEPNGKKDDIKCYKVQLNVNDILFFQKAQMNNILNTHKLIDCQKLQLPEEYADHLHFHFREVEKGLSAGLVSNFHFDPQLIKRMKEQDLSASSDTRELALNKINLPLFIKNAGSIERASTVIFCPLHHRFTKGNCKLTQEEIDINFPILQQMLEKRIDTAAEEVKKEHALAKNRHKGKGKSPSQKNNLKRKLITTTHS